MIRSFYPLRCKLKLILYIKYIRLQPFPCWTLRWTPQWERVERSLLSNPLQKLFLFSLTNWLWFLRDVVTLRLWNTLRAPCWLLSPWESHWECWDAAALHLMLAAHHPWPAWAATRLLPSSHCTEFVISIHCNRRDAGDNQSLPSTLEQIMSDITTSLYTWPARAERALHTHTVTQSPRHHHCLWWHFLLNIFTLISISSCEQYSNCLTVFDRVPRLSPLKNLSFAKSLIEKF